MTGVILTRPVGKKTAGIFHTHSFTNITCRSSPGGTGLTTLTAPGVPAAPVSDLPDPGRAKECEKRVVPQPVHCRSRCGISAVFRNAVTWHVRCGDQIAAVFELDF